ncbi:MAG: hypothetical protein ACRDZ6_04550, partial [Acidimicrobiales bacterium]
VSTAAAVLWRLRARWRSAEHPTFSAGVCVHKTGTSAQTLTQADLALYEAKRAGRDCWRLPTATRSGPVTEPAAAEHETPLLARPATAQPEVQLASH